MSAITLNDLTDRLRDCAGEPEGVDLDTTDVSDIPFIELGYDSLALLQMVSVIKREYGVDLADDDVIGVETPRLLLKLINLSLEREAA
ncbi:acyl carrier protein [Kitasatospora sp. NPDC097643]|uniref:acyl carrier protein n=1 Tax=Kitasatospora sp. NPDC097643 TaxID=3157230 RepID=UPI0033263908